MVCTGNCCSEISFDSIPSCLHLTVVLLEWVLDGELLVWQAPAYKTGNNTAGKRGRNSYFPELRKVKLYPFFVISSLSHFILVTSQLPLEASFSECAFLEKEALNFGIPGLKQLIFFSHFKISLVFCSESF